MQNLDSCIYILYLYLTMLTGSFVHWCVKSMGSFPAEVRVLFYGIKIMHMSFIYLVEAGSAMGSLVPECLNQGKYKGSHKLNTCVGYCRPSILIYNGFSILASQTAKYGGGLRYEWML